MLSFTGIRFWIIYAHVPGMMVPGFGGKYGRAYHSIFGQTHRDLADQSTVGLKKYDYSLSQSRIIHLPEGPAGEGRYHKCLEVQCILYVRSTVLSN